MADMADIFLRLFGRCPATVLKGGRESAGVCDYCNTRVFAPGGRIEKLCFLTDHGLMCAECYSVSPIRAAEIYEAGAELSSKKWYRKQYLHEEDT